MPNISSPYQQHRQAVGKHISWHDGKQGSQQMQNRRVQKLAGQPGLHAGNLNRQGTAQACVQLLSLLSTVQGSNTCFATSPERIAERTMENRLLQADASWHHHRVEQALRRESGRNNAQEGKAQAENDHPAAPDQHAEQPEHAADCSEVPTEHQTASRLPAGTPDGTAPSGISLSPEMFAPAGDDHVSSASRETGVLSEICDLPRRAYAGVSDAVAKAGSWLGDIRGPLLFAQASPPDSGTSAGGQGKLKLLALNETAARDFLTAFIGGEDGKFMAEEISKVTAGKELILMPISQSRLGKRASLLIQEAQERSAYHEYLQNNCRIRTKTVEGHPIGDHLLLTGEYIRNPWRAVSEAFNELISPGSQLSETAETASEYVNIVSDIIFGFLTLGVYPIFKYGTSKSLSVTGQGINGDRTCLKREFSPEELARLLFDTEVGITHHQPFPIFQNKPAQIAGGGKFKPSGLFVEQHLPSGIQMEKYMAIRKDGVQVLIREKAPGEFVTYHPHAADPAQLEKRVIFEPASQRIFFSDDIAREHGYDFSIVEGRKFIDVQGEQFELRYNPDKRRLEIQVEQGDVSSQWPVYKEKLSHTWHLGVHNDNAAFAARQMSLIDRLKFKGDATHTYHPVDNLNPRAYGKGKIYEVRKADAALSDAADLHVIEMHGELVPVRMQTIEGHGVRYEAYDVSAAAKRGRLVEWDGLRWNFERSTSAHVAPALKRAVDSSMFDQSISAYDLSAPDRRGIRWDRHDRGFLKIKGGFVPVRQYGYHPDAYFIAHAGKKINLFYDISRFRPENVTHRLQRIQTQGMSGRGAGKGWSGSDRTAVKIIARCYGYSPEQAEAYLREFHFEPNSLRNEREFAIYLESFGVEPPWAVRISTSAQRAAELAHASVSDPFSDPFSGQLSDPNSGQAANPYPGQAANSYSGQAANPYFGQAAYSYSGQAANPYSGQAANSYSGQAANPYSGQAANSYSGQAANSYSGQAVNSYSGQAANPYSGQAANPYSGQAANPYSGQAANPYPGQAANPYSGQAANSYSGQAANSYSGQAANSNSGPISGAAAASAPGSGSVPDPNLSLARGPRPPPLPSGRRRGNTDDDGHVSLGAQIGDVRDGSIFRDTSDNGFFIKKLKDKISDGAGQIIDVSKTARMSNADNEVVLFNHYYGESRAQKIVELGEVFVRTPKVPGKKLTELAKGEMSDDGVNRFLDMLERMRNAGVWNGDVRPENILFDRISNTFYPIGQLRNNAIYLDARPLAQRRLAASQRANQDWVINVIRQKQKKQEF